MARDTFLASALAERIRAERRARGWSQAELAERIEMSTNFVGLVERGERTPSVETLWALSDAFGTTPDRLLGYRREDSWADAVYALAIQVAEQWRPFVDALVRTAVEKSRGRPTQHRKVSASTAIPRR